MATEIPHMWSFLTPCLQVTWPGPCAVIILAYNKCKFETLYLRNGAR